MRRRIALASILALGISSFLSVDATAAPKTGSVLGTVTVKNKKGEPVKDRSNVVVYLKGVPNALPDMSKVVHKIRQKDKQFRPRLTVVLKGSTLEFPNDDRIDHNVFSLSRAARFDLGLYRSGKSKSVKVKRTGVIDVYCNIHPQMSAKIVVLDTKYYAITDKRGRFRIDKVPPGKYKIVAWHARGRLWKGKVEISKGGKTTQNISVVQRKKKKRHLRKDGTPYGRYK